MTQNPAPAPDTDCLNCGAQLTGNFCAQCGQRGTDVTLSVRLLLTEFIESIFSLEFGFWQTFKRLVFLPGALTSEYISGRRKRYSSPIRLYLGTSLIFFFCMAYLSGDIIKFSNDDLDGNTEVLTGQDAIHALQQEIVTNEAAADSSGETTLDDVPGGDNLRRFLENPASAQARFFSYLPRAMFVLVPLSALLFRLVYVRHKRPYLHYLVFSLHLHALFYLTMSVVMLLGHLKPEALGHGLSIATFFTFPLATIRAQRRAFGDGWGKAILKAGLVWHAYGFCLALAMGAVTFLTIWRS